MNSRYGELNCEGRVTINVKRHSTIQMRWNALSGIL